MWLINPKIRVVFLCDKLANIGEIVIRECTLHLAKWMPDLRDIKIVRKFTEKEMCTSDVRIGISLDEHFSFEDVS